MIDEQLPARADVNRVRAGGLEGRRRRGGCQYGSKIASGHIFYLLKFKPPRDLNVSRHALQAANDAEIGTIERCSRLAELDAVQEILRFHAKRESHRLADRNAFLKREIKLRQPRSPQRVVALCTPYIVGRCAEC